MYEWVNDDDIDVELKCFERKTRKEIFKYSPFTIDINHKVNFGDLGDEQKLFLVYYKDNVVVIPKGTEAC